MLTLIKIIINFYSLYHPRFWLLHLLPTFQRNLHRPWALMGLSHGLATLQRGYDPPRFAPIQRKIREGTPRGLQFGSFCMEGLWVMNYECHVSNLLGCNPSIDWVSKFDHCILWKKDGWLIDVCNWLMILYHPTDFSWQAKPAPKHGISSKLGAETQVVSHFCLGHVQVTITSS